MNSVYLSRIGIFPCCLCSMREFITIYSYPPCPTSILLKTGSVQNSMNSDKTTVPEPAKSLAPEKAGQSRKRHEMHVGNMQFKSLILPSQAWEIFTSCPFRSSRKTSEPEARIFYQKPKAVIPNLCHSGQCSPNAVARYTLYQKRGNSTF